MFMFGCYLKMFEIYINKVSVKYFIKEYLKHLNKCYF